MKNLDKILIAIPTFENIEPHCFKSIYGLTKPQNTIVMFDFIKGYDCARARNLIVKETLDYKFDYVFMVDSDIVLPSHALKSLYDHKKDIVLGWYLRKRTTTGQTELFSLGQKDFLDSNNINSKDIQTNGLFEIKGGGLGCALIKANIFTKLAKSKWFQYIEYEDDSILSEDTFFCSRANAAGLKIYYDAAVKCGHVNKFII